MQLEAWTKIGYMSTPSATLDVVDLADVRRDSLAFLQTRAAAEPDGFTYRVAATGQAHGERVHVLNHPAAVERILRSDLRCFTKERTPDYYMLGPVLGDGLLTTSGQLWQRQRRAMAPLFRSSTVLAFDQLVVAAAKSTAQAWIDAGATPVRRDHDLSTLTLAVLVGALLGPDHAQIGPGFGAAVDDINHYLAAFSGGPIAEDGSVETVQRNFVGAVRLIRGISAALLEAFRLDRESTALLTGLSERTDLGSMVDQVVTLVMAGHETTAKVMCWGLILLARDPDLQDRLRQEVQQVADGRDLAAGDLPDLPLTEAFVHETMRLYPPIWLMSRRALESMSFGDIRVEAEDLVCVSAWLLHRDGRWWDEPGVCRPERFLDARPVPFSYLPFGGGERICIGQHLAMMEAVLAIGTLLQHCQFDSDAPLPAPEALVTLRPGDGAVLGVTPVGVAS